MIRPCSSSITNTARRLAVRRSQPARRLASSSPSSSPSPLDSDVGPLSTRVYHGLNLGLAALTPIYFLVPDSYTDGIVNKMFGLLLAAGITVHSHIGLNYVATDYVPKISKALLGPSRFVVLGLSTITMVGLGQIAVGSPGGMKGMIKGLWNHLPKEEKKDPLKDF